LLLAFRNALDGQNRQKKVIWFKTERYERGYL